MAPDDPTHTGMPANPGATRSSADPATITSGELSSAVGGPVPTSSGRYELREEIAHGGMGVVYRATDTALSREVAVKVLQDRFGSTSAAARRFADEARIAAQLQHPAIPPVHDFGTLPDGRPFLAMKLIKGETFDALLDARPDLSHDRGRFVAAFEQVCQALAFAHAHSVIHRDLKPANVMVGNFGEVQVMDWGLAKVLEGTNGECKEVDPEETAGTEIYSLRESEGAFTQIGSVLGTPAFMPPEQAVGAVGKINARSDVFGLGAVLAVVLTGKPPFAASSVETTRVRAAQGQLDECFARLDTCGADPELVALCKRCLAPKQENRPADAGEVAKAVAELRSAADERARQAELNRVKAEGEKVAAELQAKEQRKRRKVQAALGITFTALLVFGGLALWWVQEQRRTQADEERGRRDQAERELQSLVEDAVSRFGRARGADRNPILWAEARSAARLAEARAVAASPEVRERLRRLVAEIDQLEKNRRLVATLLEIQASMGDDLLPDGNQDFPRADAQYSQAVQDYGVDLFEMTPEQGAELLGTLGNNVRVQLAAALDDWGYVRFLKTSGKQTPARIFDITSRLDPDPLRNQIRQAVTAKDTGALVKITAELDPAVHPAQTVNLVAVYLYHFNWVNGAGQADVVAFLRKAHPHHAGDFQICHNLAFSLLSASRHADALSFSMAAVAIRPRSAAAWQDYARALAGANRLEEAIAAYQRVFALAPKTVPARIEHVSVLLRRREMKKAEVTANALVKSLEDEVRKDPNNPNSAVRLADAALAIAQVYLFSNYYDEAAQAIFWSDRATELFTEYYTKWPGTPNDQKRLRTSHWRKAIALNSLDRAPEAIAEMDEALKYAPERIKPSLLMCRLRYTAKTEGHPVVTKNVRDLLAKPPLDETPVFFFWDAALAYSICVRAANGDEKLQSRYAEEAIALLKKSITFGFQDLHLLKKDKDLDPIRDRADFKVLVSDLEKKFPPPEVNR